MNTTTMPELTEAQFDQMRSVFFSYATKRQKKVEKEDIGFVHYTSAEVAVQIIKNREIWMRNVQTVNDYREVDHGYDCLNAALKSPHGETFKNALNAAFPEMYEKLMGTFRAWFPGMRHDTYITCVSEHLNSENKFGRLSMWRAYGNGTGVAIVLNNKPFFATSELNAFASPVKYANRDEFAVEFEETTKLLADNTAFLKAIGPEWTANTAFNMLRFAVLCTKHPGFEEEKEWRVIYSPALNPSHIIKSNVETVQGTPQRVCKIPLRDNPKYGFVGVELKDFLKLVIVGPTKFPNAMYPAFATILAEADVPNPIERIAVSDIPLRV